MVRIEEDKISITLRSAVTVVLHKVSVQVHCTNVLSKGAYAHLPPQQYSNCSHKAEWDLNTSIFFNFS